MLTPDLYELFSEAIRRSAIYLKQGDNFNVEPRLFLVYAPGSPVDPVSKEHALSLVTIDQSRFYKFIDVGTIIKDGQPVGFVRVSGHDPVPFSETFNPQDLGPFRTVS